MQHHESLVAKLEAIQPNNQQRLGIQLGRGGGDR